MTRRLFAYIGISMLVAFSVVFYLGFCGVIIIFSLCAAAVLGVFLLKGLIAFRSAAVLIAIAAVLSVAYFNYYSSSFYMSAEKYKGETEVVAVVTDIPREQGSIYYYELQSESIGGERCDMKIIFRSEHYLSVSYGDIIKCNMKLAPTSNKFYNSWSVGLFGIQNGGPSFQLIGKDTSVRFFPVFLREKLSSAIHSLIPGDEGDLCCAVILGERYGLSDELYSDFYETGLCYNIVVSGMHMSIIAMTAVFCLRFLGKRRLPSFVRFVILFLVIAFYMAVTGMSPSVIRSGIMILFPLFGAVIFRKSDSYNSLGFAAMLITAENPLSVGNIGVLLSFGSTLGILFFLPRVMLWYDSKFEKRNKKLNGIIKVNEKNRGLRHKARFKLIMYKALRLLFQYAAVSASALTAVTPITLVFFGTANPLVVLSSVFVAPFISILMFFGLLASILFYVPFAGIIGEIPAFAAEKLGSWVIAVVRVSASIPNNRLFVYPGLTLVWLALFVALISIALLRKNKLRCVITAVLISLSLIGAGMIGGYFLEGGVKLRVFSCGRGVTTLVQSGERNSLLSCGGYSSFSSSIVNELNYTAGSVDFLVVPSEHWSRSSYKEALVNEFDVDDILLYYKSTDNEKLFREKSLNCKVFTENVTLTTQLCSGVKDTILNRNGHTWQFIDSGETTVLIAPEYGEIDELPEKYRSPDYLVVSAMDDCYREIDCGCVIWSAVDKAPDFGREVIETNAGTVTIDLRRN